MSQSKSGYVPFVDSSSPPGPQGYMHGQPNPVGFVLPPPDYNGMPGVPGAPGAPGEILFSPPGAFMHPMYGQGGPGFPQAPFPQAAPYNPAPPNPTLNPAPNPTPYQYTPGEGVWLGSEQGKLFNFIIKKKYISLIVLTVSVLWNTDTSDNFYQTDEPPPGYNNEDITISGFDDKAVRRAFIRKVKKTVFVLVV